MKHKPLKVLLTTLGIFATASTIAITHSNQVDAAYYRGAKVTTPKSIRGTWYGYNLNKLNKMKITAHTVSLPKLNANSPHGTFTLYKQNKKIYRKASGNLKYMEKANKYAYKHRWMNTWTYNYQGFKWLGIDPYWLDAGDNDYGGGLRATTINENGRSIKQLILQNPNSIKYFYKSPAIAKNMK